MNDYYADLGVPRDASPEEIKRSYRRQARKLHPDVNPGPEAEAQFKKLSQAYDVLGDPEKRRAYDHGADPYGGAGRGPRSRVQRGQDALIRVEIDLHTAVFGGEQSVLVDTAVVCGTCQGQGAQPGTGQRSCDVCGGRGEVQQIQRSFLGQVMTTRPCTACQGFGSVISHPCFDCSGQGRVRRQQSRTVQVPAGVDSGIRLQMVGEGEVGLGGGPPGDLYVEIVVARHETFHRRGDDLHCTVELPMTAAALGTTMTLNTLDGPAEVSVRPGSHSGEVITLKGHGVTHLRGTGRGDLLVHLTVLTPTRLTADQEALLRQLAALRGEEQPAGKLTNVDSGGLFGRLRDAFLGK